MTATSSVTSRVTTAATIAATSTVPGPAGPPAQPPLTWRGHLWRVLLAGAAGVLLFGLLVAELPPAYPAWVDGLLTADLVLLGPLALGLLLLHRRFPLPVAVVVTLLTAVSAVAAGAGLLVLVSVSTRRRWREIVPLALLATGCWTVNGLLYPGTDVLIWPAQVAGALLLAAVSVGWGLFLGARRELVESWRLRAADADREQVLAAERAREAERARIAREMHDVLAHRLSLLSMHAGALAFRGDLPAETVRDEAGVIQRTAREALDELRGVLGVLRSGDPAASAGAGAEPPQPTLADLTDLVAQARAAGPVDLAVRTGDPVPPAPLGRHVYRIVQEALTNARKHAPGARVVVTVEGAPDAGLVVDVRNPAPPAPVATAPGTGLGLVGVRERVELVGGTLAHGALPDGGYAVTARLPWPAESAGA